MPNNFTSIRPIAYSAMRNASRELVGILGAANTSFDSKDAAEGDSVKVPRVAAVSNSDYAPAMTTSVGADTIASTDDVTITKSRQNDWFLTHADIRSLRNAGTYEETIRLRVIEGRRALINELERDCWIEAYRNASRATGTAGTTPFASNLGSLAQVKKLLDDNGAPDEERAVIFDTTAGANLRTLTQLTDAGSNGSNATLRNGTLLRTMGLDLRESAQIGLHTRGTGASYLLNNGAGYAVDSRTLAVDTGTGTLLAGDVLTFGADTNLYVANTALSGGSFTIGRPGLRAAAADNAAVTIGNNYTANIALHRNALAVVARPPTIEPNGNMSVEPIPDDLGKVTMMLCEIIGDGMTTWRLHLAWGVKAVSSEHIVVLRG